jgi:hypothetical protein
MDFSITHDQLIKHKDGYIKLTSMTEETIRDIWYVPGELYIEDLTTIKYENSHPLWLKNVFRYRQSFSNPVMMWNGLDPSNRARLLRHFLLPVSDKSMDFFMWMASSLSADELTELTSIKDNLLKRVQTDCIGLFFELPTDVQQNIVNIYNLKMKQFSQTLPDDYATKRKLMEKVIFGYSEDD